MTPQEHAADMIKAAMHMLGRVRAMRLTPGERQAMHKVYDQLQKLRNSVTEGDNSSIKIRAV